MVERKVKVVDVTCDVCGEPTTRGAKKCEMCNRDLCRRCAVYDSSHCGDYMPFYCKTCWEAGKPFRERRVELEADHDRALEKLEADWKAAAFARVERGE
jgi:hypothetical protein